MDDVVSRELAERRKLYQSSDCALQSHCHSGEGGNPEMDGTNAAIEVSDQTDTGSERWDGEGSAKLGLLVYELLRLKISEGTTLPTCGPLVAAKSGYG